MTLVCTIGSTDPWNAAGLGLDVRIIAELGARAVSIVAGVTAQDANGLRASAPLDGALLEAQFDALQDAPIDAYRIGALLDVASIEIVARRLRGVTRPIVYDPALGPSAGGRFIDAGMRVRILSDLLTLPLLVTPNLAEAAFLGGSPVEDLETMAAAGRAFRRAGAAAALIKGGHLRDRAVDVLIDAQGMQRYEDARIEGDMRGTGCILAAALSVALGRGEPLREAVTSARAIVSAKLRAAVTLGGMRLAP